MNLAQPELSVGAHFVEIGACLRIVYPSVFVFSQVREKVHAQIRVSPDFSSAQVVPVAVVFNRRVLDREQRRNTFGGSRELSRRKSDSGQSRGASV